MFVCITQVDFHVIRPVGDFDPFGAAEPDDEQPRQRLHRQRDAEGLTAKRDAEFTRCDPHRRAKRAQIMHEHCAWPVRVQVNGITIPGDWIESLAEVSSPVDRGVVQEPAGPVTGFEHVSPDRVVVKPPDLAVREGNKALSVLVRVVQRLLCMNVLKGQGPRLGLLIPGGREFARQAGVVWDLPDAVRHARQDVAAQVSGSVEQRQDNPIARAGFVAGGIGCIGLRVQYLSMSQAQWEVRRWYNCILRG